MFVPTFEEPGDDTVDVELVPLLRLGPRATAEHLVRFHLTHLFCHLTVLCAPLDVRDCHGFVLAEVAAVPLLFLPVVAFSPLRLRSLFFFLTLTGWSSSSSIVQR